MNSETQREGQAPDVESLERALDQERAGRHHAEKALAQMQVEARTHVLLRRVGEISARAITLSDGAHSIFRALFQVTGWRAGFVWRPLENGMWMCHGSLRKNDGDASVLESVRRNQLPAHLVRSADRWSTRMFEEAVAPSSLPSVLQRVSSAALPGHAGGLGFVELWSAASSTKPVGAQDLLERIALELGVLLRRDYSADSRGYLRERDSLTGLLNRVGFIESLQNWLDTEPPGEVHSAGLVVADLMDFAACNDLLGHAAADRLLVEFGRRLSAAVPADVPVARISANAFAFPVRVQGHLVSVTEFGHARDVILAVADTAFGADQGIVGRLECRSGIAAATGDGGADELLAGAETALRVAKKDGARTRFFEPTMTRRAGRAAQLRFALSKALEKGEFRVCHQPIVDLQTGRIMGAEALLRWSNEEHGEVPCPLFIPMLEESRLIRPVGAWVLEQSLRVAASMRGLRDGDWLQTVNVSAIQFGDPDFAESVKSALARHGVPPRMLEIEITESVLLQPSPRVAATLNALSEAGVRIALDDFGTGFSALSYLRSFEVDRLKIDRTFVRDAGASPRAGSLVSCIVAIANALSMDLIGEGVESGADRDFLLRNGCRLGQGFGLARPLDESQLTALVQSKALLYPED